MRLLVLGLTLLSSTLACNLTATDPTPTMAPSPPTTGGLTVAWVDGAQLQVWTSDAKTLRMLVSGDETTTIGRPLLSPDAQTVAYTSGQPNNPQTLWIVSTAGSAPQELVGPSDLPAPDETVIRQIGQVAWLDGQTLIFNTHLVPRQPAPGGGKAYDLWRVDRTSGAVLPLLPDGQGGDFAISPDGVTIALSTPGRYGQTEGRIHRVDATGQQAATLLTYPAVSTASEYAFSPHLHWLDTTTLLTAIPDPDLIYPTGPDETPRTATLWRLTVDGEAAQLGAVPAAFFGLPRWSSNGAWLTYLQQVGAPSDNTLALMLADGSGNNAQEIVTGSAGALSPATWRMSGFFYTAGSPGDLWRGSPTESPARFPAGDQAVFWPLWAGPDALVFATAPVAPYELRTYHLETGTTTPIATVQTGHAAFDAVQTP